MKIDGLGDNRRSALFQIRTLVEENEAFSNDQFSRMVDQYKKEDPVMHQILDESRQMADSNYTRFLNNMLVNGKFGLASFEFGASHEEPTVLGKVMNELRERIKCEKDYRKKFLGPQIGQQARYHEIQHRRAQKEEIKLQRQEMKALSKSQRKGSGFFDFGL